MWIGTSTTTSQAAYINSFDTSQVRRMPEIVDSSIYLVAENPDRDPLVKTDQAVTEWRKLLPDLAVRVVEGRQGTWHIPWVYRPLEVLRMV